MLITCNEAPAQRDQMEWDDRDLHTSRVRAIVTIDITSVPKQVDRIPVKQDARKENRTAIKHIRNNMHRKDDASDRANVHVDHARYKTDRSHISEFQNDAQWIQFKKRQTHAKREDRKRSISLLPRTRTSSTRVVHGLISFIFYLFFRGGTFIFSINFLPRSP